ncbi:hypothetical protein LCGC14_2599570, partial [marine sediment metagenome]
MAEQLELIITIDEKGAVKGVRKLNKAVKKTTEVTKEATTQQAGFLSKLKGSWLAVVGGIAATGIAIRATIGVAAKFEQAIANVAAVSGGATDELEKLARQAGKETVFTATQAANALLLLAQAGLSADESAKVLVPTLNFAAATNLQLADATSLVVSQLKIFGAELDKAEEFTDILAKTTASSNTNIFQLQGALGFASSTAKLAGISFKDLNAILGSLANRGIRGERAGVQLRQALLRLVKPTKASEEELAKLGISLLDIQQNIKDPIKLFSILREGFNTLGTEEEKLAAATEILGVRQADIFGLITEGIPDIKDLQGTLAAAGGTAQTMADKQLDTLNGAIKLLQSAFQELVIGGAKEGGLLGFFKSIILVLRDTIKAFTQLPKFIKGAAVAASIAIPIFLVLKAVLNPIGAILTVVSLGALAVAGAFQSMNKEVENSEDSF